MTALETYVQLVAPATTRLFNDPLHREIRRQMTTILLNTYLQDPTFESIIHQIHDAVCNNDLVKHYFMLAKKSAIIQDIKRYRNYLAPKSALDYRRPATPSASSDIQLPDSQFSEIILIMSRVFRDYKITPEHVPQLTHEILELMEESRSQTNDTVSSKLEAKEVSVDKIQYFLKRYKIISEVMPSKALMAERGLSHKLWLRMEPEQQEIHIEGRIIILDAAFDDQIEEVLERQSARESVISLQRETDDSGRRRLLARHALPYSYGVPMRLFVRYLNRFSMDFNNVHSLDKENILRPA